jgi:hypothetical protein
VTTRGAFHRQGPFVGSGGLYSPGPATALEHRLSTMWRPLNDVLTSSWVSAGPPREAFSRPVEADSPAFSSRGAPTDVLTPMVAPC